MRRETAPSVYARDLIDLDAVGWDAVVADAAVFARVSPEQNGIELAVAQEIVQL